MIHQRSCLALATVLCSTVLLGCASDILDPGGCAGEVSLAVQGGPAPEFSWTPPCGVLELGVTQQYFDPSCQCLMGRVLWVLESRDADRNQLEPSIRYGQAPTVARTTHAAEPLTSGEEYEVVLTRLNLQGTVRTRHTAGRLTFP